MWRAVVRQLRRGNGLQLELGKVCAQEPQICTGRRSSSSVVSACLQATSFSNSEAVELGLDLRASPALTFVPPPAIINRELNPLEESVTALDAALHRAVHLPWLANSIWWNNWLTDQKTDQFEHSNAFRDSGSSATFGNSVGGKSFTSAAALEGLEEEKLPYDVGDETEEPQPLKVKTVEAKRQKSSRTKLYARQMEIETMAWRSAAAEYRELLLDMCKKNLAPNLPFVQSLLLGWFEPFRNAIEAEQKAVENLEFKEHRAGYGPYLAQLPADMLAVITMHKLMGMLMIDFTPGGCVKVVTAAYFIGEAVETEVGIYKLLRKKEKKKGKKKGKKVEVATAPIQPNESAAESAPASKESDPSSEAVEKLQNKVKALVKKQHLRLARNLIRHASGDEPWNGEIRVKVGSFLIELLLNTAFVQSPASQSGQDNGEMRPAFKHSMKTFGGGSGVGRQFGVIECDPLILGCLDKSVKSMVLPYMPMIVEPKRWKAFNKGGYLVLPANVMRIHGAFHQKVAIEKSPSRMKNIYEALNYLGSVSWKINTRVLDVVEKIWADGGRLAELVDAENLPLPPKPSGDNDEEIKIWRRETSRIRRINCERHCLRCDTELKLDVARRLRDEELFYYPHNLDFRGRAYPLHPHLHHLGSDMCRGILEFGRGCELGPNGLKWLKIHLANVFACGVDKKSFEGRVAFVDEHLDEVFDSAQSPLEGRRWWLNAEDPFQCLAACMTVRDALLSENVETFVSYLPIHQDGSCNGLQHYAALGRDQIGAESVNLMKGEQPADVYTGIAVRVREVIEKDAADDPSTNANVGKAKLLLEQIDRKLVKQTVMTSVYGVTFVGARSQILNRLKERGLADEVNMFQASSYAAKITIDALGEMFKEARCIMNWLGDCAKIIASEGEPVKWTTPMGLPVVQPYRKPSRKMVKTSLQVLALKEVGNQPVAVSRQKSAFPPNFVHSLDGSHMMMTALACQKADVYFAGVHDSFWTHAGTIEKLNCLLREKFVELYSEPILENVLAGFKEQFPYLEFPEVPQRGDFNLSEVIKSPYFFN